MPNTPVRRRAAALPAGRMTMSEIAHHLGISVITLRRRIRPTGDRKTRSLWTERLDLKVRERGKSIPVYHARRRCVEQWGAEITGHDLPVKD